MSSRCQRGCSVAGVNVGEVVGGRRKKVDQATRGAAQALSTCKLCTVRWPARVGGEGEVSGARGLGGLALLLTVLGKVAFGCESHCAKAGNPSGSCSGLGWSSRLRSTYADSSSEPERRETRTPPLQIRKPVGTQAREALPQKESTARTRAEGQRSTP